MDEWRMIRRRKLAMSAPPLSRLPRIDSADDRRALIDPNRRRVTADLRRQFLESRRQQTVAADDTRTREMQQLRNYKQYLDQLRMLQDKKNLTKNAGNSDTDNQVLKQEVTKRPVPERLPIHVHIHLPPTVHQERMCDDVKTSVPLFQTTGDKTCRHKRPQTSKRHFFIGRDWSSEKISLVRFNRNAPELFRRSWIG